ncbi:MAG: M24 family metallopeptidase [Gemmatimonadales bacterium]
MADRRPERLEALRRSLSARGLDALIVASLPNIRYLTGFSGTSALVLVCQDQVLFLSDFRYQAQSEQEVSDLARIAIEPGGLWERLFNLMGELTGVRRVGYESHHLSAHQASKLEGPGRPWQFAGTTDLVEALREVKSVEEIGAIRRAGALAMGALAATSECVRAGQTELEVAAMLEGALRRGGSEWFPFPTIVASGPRTALPHAHTSDRVIAPGDLLLLDFGAVVDGYCSDVTRTFVVGREPTAEQSRIHELVRAAQAAALAGLRAGLTGRQADALARDVIQGGGHGEAFGHSLGHGVGLEVHEGPRLAKTAGEALPAGSVVTVEPGIYLEGWGGVRIEDDVVLAPHGAQLLTEYTRELVRLG